MLPAAYMYMCSRIAFSSKEGVLSILCMYICMGVLLKVLQIVGAFYLRIIIELAAIEGVSTR